MSETLADLRRKMSGAGKLQSVVRTMKALAASNIGQYESAVRALADYDRTVELGLVAFFRQGRPASGAERTERMDKSAVGAVVFGSDQGLVGKFNEALVDFTVDALGALPGEKKIWAVGERVHARLKDADLPPMGAFAVPNSVTAITPLVGQILIECEMHRRKGEVGQVYLFHNRPTSGAIYEPVSQRLLPLDEKWRRKLTQVRWPTVNLPEVLVDGEITLQSLIREYLFVSMFKACAESLAGENASRLAAMQRAEKNIDELLEDLSRTFHRLRQSGIDEELFDVISGYESLNIEKK
ncbi:MAG: F0F1 ATP synthase subunit gamma [Deltaproteobacteria bacterium]|nr:F0F1 ATP synthase subunit gamma [Deltaproteobacteria bacterium]MBW1719191.1 F0F1 ATP synthase subunit gamma [Deltaproteobacteria bacterium]MBW2080682.1 F0F1 ATP synthase subunit gamma [Deltaproteobacteria bacterium]